ncbi:GTP cyclohydrolase I [Kribbella italica]|uniref:GTP cyclohydrolase 1 n=1 Tax=Kribbella italica TaxID=1540520 RepID=A0A7W9MZU3_9ACTN|nr:GTP cyclohydrolase I [Kribbella italica]MBB5841608.1 GTP cyclohydrolase I [Kribbella italica]
MNTVDLTPLDVATQWNGDENRGLAAARVLLGELGMECTDESTKETPARFVQALRELTSGSTVDPRRHLQVTFPAVGRPTLITATSVPFTSVCEHHLLPFTGHATVAYLPTSGAPIVGISKLARVVQEYAARPQMQERIGEQVVDALTSSLDVQGAACLLKATHACMTLRGVGAAGASIATDHLRGALETDANLRDRLFAAANR